MIKGVHAMFYSPQAEACRNFLRDTLGLPHFDAGDGWLIFRAPANEIGCHPTDGGTKHEVSFYCDDIEQTVAELAAKGVEFTGPIRDQGYGLVTQMKLPGGVFVDLYQPAYAGFDDGP